MIATVRDFIAVIFVIMPLIVFVMAVIGQMWNLAVFCLLFAIFFALVVLFWRKSASEASEAATGETEISTETLEN